MDNNPKKVCKFCKSVIDKNHKVCPNCNKSLEMPIWKIITITLVCILIPLIIAFTVLLNGFKSMFNFAISFPKKIYHDYYNDDYNYYNPSDNNHIYNNYNNIFTKGSYVVGDDINEGTYDITAISGQGSLSIFLNNEHIQNTYYIMDSKENKTSSIILNKVSDQLLSSGQEIIITGNLNLKFEIK